MRNPTTFSILKWPPELLVSNRPHKLVGDFGIKKIKQVGFYIGQLSAISTFTNNVTNNVKLMPYWNWCVNWQICHCIEIIISNKYILPASLVINALMPGDAYMRQWTKPSLRCWLLSTIHYLKLCWSIANIRADFRRKTSYVLTFSQAMLHPDT